MRKRDLQMHREIKYNQKFSARLETTLLLTSLTIRCYIVSAWSGSQVMRLPYILPHSHPLPLYVALLAGKSAGDETIELVLSSSLPRPELQPERPLLNHGMLVLHCGSRQLCCFGKCESHHVAGTVISLDPSSFNGPRCIGCVISAFHLPVERAVVACDGGSSRHDFENDGIGRSEGRQRGRYICKDSFD